MFYIIAPTYKEPLHVKKFIKAWEKYNNVKLIIVNANPNDLTSNIIQSHKTSFVREIESNSEKFWSGLVNVGLIYLKNIVDSQDKVILTNIDTYPTFKKSCLNEILVDLNFNKIISGVVKDKTYKPLVSGTKVISWFFNIKKKYYCPTRIIGNITYCPTRFIILPSSVIKSEIKVNERVLFHYGGDTEFTFRLNKLGYRIYIDPKFELVNDSQNSGLKKQKIILTPRNQLFNPKSSINLKSQSNFIDQVYPKYAKISGGSLQLVKIILLSLFIYIETIMSEVLRNKK